MASEFAPRRRRSREIARLARAYALDAWERLPPGSVDDVRDAVMRLRQARTPRGAIAAFEEELERLFEELTPRLVEHPLPFRTPSTARAAVTVIAGSAAAIDEIEFLALLLPGVNAINAPAIPLAIAAAFAALVLEAYVAASLRVHMLEAAGKQIDPARIANDTMRAMTGRAAAKISRTAAQQTAGRMTRRWAKGVVPVVGIGYAGWDAQRTVAEIARMEI